MATRTKPSPYWTLDLLDDGDVYADGGRDVRVQLRHSRSGLVLEGTVVYYGGSHEAVIRDLNRDELLLPACTTARLLAKVTAHYLRTVGHYGDCGMRTSLNFPEVTACLFLDTSEAEALNALVDTAVRTFAPEVPPENENAK